MGTNNRKQSGLDIEALNAKMNALDNKAEKEKEVQQKVVTLDELLNSIVSESLVMKDMLRQIDETKRSLEVTYKNIDSTKEKYENLLAQLKEIPKEVSEMTVTSKVSQESMTQMTNIFSSHYSLLLKFRKDLSDDLIKHQTDFNNKLSGVLSHSGFWCTDRIFRWMVVIFMPSLVISIMGFTLLLSGHIHIN